MADRPPAPASRVGRSRTRSLHQSPCVPVAPKVGSPRSKSVCQPKVKDLPKKKLVKTILPLEPNILVINPVEQPKELDFPYPQDQLPDLPLVEQDQAPNNPQPNQPNPQPNLPNQQQNIPTEQPNLPPNQPNQPNQPNLPENPPTSMANPQQLNWSYFKPEFAGKPEDVEAHLLRTNDWMETHDFPDNTRVRRFCFTLMGEVRLWYETLRPAQLNWAALQEHFRQQYSKFGSTREQYFHVFRSFHYDENTDTIDSSVSKVK